MNRIETKIAKNKIHLATANLSQEKIDKADSDMKLEFTEHFSFQNMKSEAMLAGLITQEEAQTVYQYLGETASVFNSQPLAVRVTLMGLFGELAEWKIAQMKKKATDPKEIAKMFGKDG